MRDCQLPRCLRRAFMDLFCVANCILCTEKLTCSRFAEWIIKSRAVRKASSRNLVPTRSVMASYPPSYFRNLLGWRKWGIKCRQCKPIGQVSVGGSVDAVVLHFPLAQQPAWPMDRDEGNCNLMTTGGPCSLTPPDIRDPNPAPPFLFLK